METNLALQLTDLEQTIETAPPAAVTADRSHLTLVAARPPAPRSRVRLRTRLRTLTVRDDSYRAFRIY